MHCVCLALVKAQRKNLRTWYRHTGGQTFVDIYREKGDRHSMSLTFVQNNSEKLNKPSN